MFDIGWSELVLIGIVSLVVVGPKELPGMFRTLGRVAAKGRMMARDFQRAMEDAADGAGLKDIQRDLNAMRSPMQSGLDVVNRKLDDWDEKARAARAASKPAGAATPVAANGAAPPSAPPETAASEAPAPGAPEPAGPPPELRASAPNAPQPVQQPAATGLPGDENKA